MYIYSFLVHFPFFLVMVIYQYLHRIIIYLSIGNQKISRGHWSRYYYLFSYLVYFFLAPTGAQEMLMFVCSVQTCLEQSIFIFLGQRAIEHSENTQTTVKEQSKKSQRALKALKSESHQSEPKILRLVKYLNAIPNTGFGTVCMTSR